MATEQILSTLTINKVDSKETFNKMKAAGLVNDDELYLTPESGSGSGSGSLADGTTAGIVNPISKTSDMTQSVGVDSDGKLWTFPTTGTGGGSSYTLPIANATTLGGVKPVTKTSAMTQQVGVDSNGLLYTAPSSSSGGGMTSAYVVASSAPTNTGMLWIDSASSNVLKFYNGSAWVAVGAVWG